MDINIDFDGTCVTHEYPKIGKDIGAIPVLKRLVQNGHRLIIFTMRSDGTLDEAVNWFEENDIPLFGIQTNPTQNWTTSPKSYAQLMIDDSALGCPLKCFYREIEFNGEKVMVKDGRNFVDWKKVEKLLESEGILKT